MKPSNFFLWVLILLFAGLVTWLASTGRLQELVDSIVDGYWNFYENIVRTLRR